MGPEVRTRRFGIQHLGRIRVSPPRAAASEARCRQPHVRALPGPLEGLGRLLRLRGEGNDRLLPVGSDFEGRAVMLPRQPDLPYSNRGGADHTSGACIPSFSGRPPIRTLKLRHAGDLITPAMPGHGPADGPTMKDAATHEVRPTADASPHGRGTGAPPRGRFRSSLGAIEERCLQEKTHDQIH
jgi:hypothetical protein